MFDPMADIMNMFGPRLDYLLGPTLYSKEIAVDMYQTDDEFVLELEAPGYEEKDITIDLSNNILTISGEHKLEKDIMERSYLLQERSFISFSRQFEIPKTVDTEKLIASFKKGVLKLKAPNSRVDQSRKIEIGS
jgi:HSP20 family protein